MAPKVETYDAGSLPITLALCQEAGIAQEINAMVNWRAQKDRICPGSLIELMIGMIIEGHNPLSQMEYYWSSRNRCRLFENPELAAQLTDDDFGRALDSLSEVKKPELISRVFLRIKQISELSLKTIHLDTTSISVEGAYEEEREGEEFSIGYGYSKDMRPDLKQFKIGLGVQSNGIPVYGQLLSGNMTDDEWNRDSIQEMTRIFTAEEYADILYVGDSSTVSSYESIGKLAGIRYVSRLPGTFALVEEVKREAYTQEMQPCGQFGDEHSAQYKLWSRLVTIQGQTLRVIVVHSDALDARKEKTLARNAEKRLRATEALCRKSARQTFACAPDAASAAMRTQQEAQALGYCVEYRVNEAFCYKTRGRPQRDATPESKFQIQYHSLQQDTSNQDWARFEASTFVLITSELDVQRMSDAEILREYKNQISVENGFRFLKQPVYLGRVFLKKQSRVEALGYVYLLVLMLASWITYRVRQGIAQTGEQGLQLDNGKYVKHPSAQTILRELYRVSVILLDGVRYFDADSHPTIERICGFLALDIALFASPLPVF